MASFSLPAFVRNPWFVWGAGVSAVALGIYLLLKYMKKQAVDRPENAAPIFSDVSRVNQPVEDFTQRKDDSEEVSKPKPHKTLDEVLREKGYKE